MVTSGLLVARKIEANAATGSKRCRARRPEVSMQFWDLPSGDAPRQEPSQGFRDALQVLQERRYRELGTAWQRQTQRARRAEAARRARQEMARRMAGHTGRRALSQRTIARWAGADKPPAGVDKHWLDRWAAIDRAGGIKKLAQELGVSQGQVRRWRDSPDPKAPPPGGTGVPGAPTQPIGVETDGWVMINGKLYPKHIPTDPDEDCATLYVDPAGELMRASFDNDTDLLNQMLGEEITEQIIIPTWDNLPHPRDRLPR